jgi:hypothetical protein
MLPQRFEAHGQVIILKRGADGGIDPLAGRLCGLGKNAALREVHVSPLFRKHGENMRVHRIDLVVQLAGLFIEFHLMALHVCYRPFPCKNSRRSIALDMTFGCLCGGTFGLP